MLLGGTVLTFPAFCPGVLRGTGSGAGMHTDLCWLKVIFPG